MKTDTFTYLNVNSFNTGTKVMADYPMTLEEAMKKYGSYWCIPVNIKIIKIKKNK